MGKVVVLGGNARSGKTTLSYMLVKRGFSRISFDNIHEISKNSLGVDINEFSDERKFILFSNIIKLSLEEVKTGDINIVIDMYDYLPKDINDLEYKEKIEVYFLAYPNCTKEQIKHNVIYYSKPTDWIAQVNEEYLNECVERFYNRNELLVNECKKYNFELIDTKEGKERDHILKKLLKKIVEE